MSLEKFKIAIPTKGRGGLKDVVSDVFGRANTFTVVDVDNGVIKSVKVIENPAVSYKHGAGPIVVKMLADLGVNVLIAAELGPGASTLIEQHKITRIAAQPGETVEESIKKTLLKVKK